MKTRKTRRERRNNRRPLLEGLESRVLRTVTLHPADGVLEITGSTGNDYFEIQMISSTEFQVRPAKLAPGAPLTGMTFSTVVSAKYKAAAKSVVVKLDQGNDTLQVLPGYHTTDPTFALPMTVYGDSGSSAATKVSGGQDRIVTGAGNDTIYGYGGCDSINSGDGDDTVYGYDLVGTYPSTVGNDADTIDAGNGADHVYGGPDSDFILGGAGRDILLGNELNDTIYGGKDNDWIYGEGTGTIAGWEGMDTLFGDDGPADSVETDDENDSIYGGAMDDTLYSQGGGGWLLGEDGNDVIYGGGGNDEISGGSGNDTISAYAGLDTVSGGSGNDTIYAGDGDDSVNGDDGVDAVYGEDGNDILHGGTGSDGGTTGIVSGGDGNDRLFGDDGDDVLDGGDGNDLLFLGAGTDVATGGAGDDILVSIDDAITDTLYGGTGFDSFWIDRNPGLLGRSETIMDADSNELETNVHKVEKFENGADKTLDGDAIDDPTDGDYYTDFSSKPLFASTGPTADDIFQGSVGDCWLMSSLAAAAGANQNAIYQAVVDLGDGTYCVELDNKQYRVDADLAHKDSVGGDIKFAKLGQEDCLWPALIEKAYALHRDGTYASISGDTPYFALGKLDGTNRKIWGVSDSDDADDELAKIDALLKDGYGVTFCTKAIPTGIHPLFSSYLYGDHCYTVVGVDYDSSSLILRNPWGSDLRGGTYYDDADDGYVTIPWKEIPGYGENPFCFVAADFSAFS